MMNNKEKYKLFCEKTYVPVFSKPWWMDAVCGQENWDVWVCESDGTQVNAVMPYYTEDRHGKKYITKAPLTQVNGLFLCYPDDQKLAARQAYEEKIYDEAIDYIESLKLDVYEQQFHHTVSNFLPFWWRCFTAIPRFTYVIEDTSDMTKVEADFTANCRKNMRKGYRNIDSFSDLTPEQFYAEHEKIYLRQGLKCPFSYDFWVRLYTACQENDAGKIIATKDAENNVLSLMFVVWDEKALYPLLGGAMPEYANLQTYTALTHKSIELASEKGLMYDFEGSVIKRINHAFREFGGTPKQYFRIRKVFDPAIIRAEAEQKIQQLSQEQ